MYDILWYCIDTYQSFLGFQRIVSLVRRLLTFHRSWVRSISTSGDRAGILVLGANFGAWTPHVVHLLANTELRIGL